MNSGKKIIKLSAPIIGTYIMYKGLDGIFDNINLNKERKKILVSDEDYIIYEKEYNRKFSEEQIRDIKYMESQKYKIIYPQFDNKQIIELVNGNKNNKKD